MNPYFVSTSDVSKPESVSKRPIAFLILGLALLQFLWFLFYMSMYFKLVRIGAVSVLTGLSGFLGCILLYAGATRFAVNPAKGNRLFFASAVFALLSLKGWGLHYFSSYSYVFAAAIAAAGWWFSRRRSAFASN